MVKVAVPARHIATQGTPLEAQGGSTMPPATTLERTQAPATEAVRTAPDVEAVGMSRSSATRRPRGSPSDSWDRSLGTLLRLIRSPHRAQPWPGASSTTSVRTEVSQVVLSSSSPGTSGKSGDVARSPMYRPVARSNTICQLLSR
ncbi:MAG: hypothetical protein JWO11_3211 [Nocardioides sp.]|nr:hypothetical protein [Nocardioides sp.]